MKKKFLKTLKCLNCGSGNFSISKSKSNNMEIRKGVIACNKCNIKFYIKDGIVNLLHNPDPEIIKQRKIIYNADKDADGEGLGFSVNQKNVRSHIKQFISLPEGDNSSFFDKGAFKNISLWSKRYYSFFNILKLTGKEKVLELGADFCWSINKFAEKGCNCVAVDINHHLIASDIYMSKCKTYFERCISDMNNLAFKDEYFDIVFCSATLHHSLDIKTALKEINRVLKPGGRLCLVCEPVLGLLFYWRKLIFGRKARKLGIHEQEYTLLEWIHLMKNTSFQPELIFSLHRKSKTEGGWIKIFKNKFIKKILLKTYLYPLLILSPYNVDFIAHKKKN